MDRRTRRMLTRAPAPLLWMGLIFVLSEQTGSPGTAFDDVLRVIAHFALYAILALLCAWALAPISAVSALLVFAIALVYALTDEYHQSMVPGRDASAFDICIDAGGAGVAVLWLRFGVGRVTPGESKRSIRGRWIADD